MLTLNAQNRNGTALRSTEKEKRRNDEYRKGNAENRKGIAMPSAEVEMQGVALNRKGKAWSRYGKEVKCIAVAWRRNEGKRSGIE